MKWRIEPGSSQRSSDAPAATLTIPVVGTRLKAMGMSLRHLHRCMTDSRSVELDDGRLARIVRVDTEFPANQTTVSVWADTPKGPSLTKVDLTRIVGPAPNTEAPPKDPR